ncbi:MAG: hypothetical protein ACRD04_05210 [Terriglobales bacterium]
MIFKQCSGCGHYFAGQFDGDYSCAECRRAGIARARPLLPLAVSVDADTLASPRPAQPMRNETTRVSVRGQAA